MFSKEQVKEFIIKLGKKVIFPEITNVISRRVLTVGVIIVLGVNPYAILAINLLIDTINNSGKLSVSIPHVNDERADYIWGVVLIVLVMLHNISYQWFKFYNEKLDKQHNHEINMASDIREEQQRVRDIEYNRDIEERRSIVDGALFERFLSIFPSNSMSAELLRTHDFWESYHVNRLNEIESFVELWNTEETRFLNEDIEKARYLLWRACFEFTHELALRSSYVGYGDMLSVVPEYYRGVMDTPQEIDERVDNINNKSAECFGLYKSFIRLCREKLNK